MGKKLLYICNRVFWPPMGGHEVEMFHYCRGLHEQFGYTIDVYIFDDKGKIDFEKKPSFLNDIIVSETIKRTEKISNIIKKSLLTKKPLPLQCSLYYSLNNQKKISITVKDGNYDVIIVDMVRLAPYYCAFTDSKAKKILDIDDTLSKRYKRQLLSLDEKTTIAGQYNERLPVFFQKLLNSKFVKKCVLKFEIPRMEKAEEYFGKVYDNVIFVSPIETDEFNSKYPGNKAVTVAMGVDYKYFSQNVDVDVEKGVASFVGNMKTAANIDSVRMIINEIIPHSRLLKRIDFIGGCLDSLQKEFEDNPKVRFTGRVDDLRPFVKSSELFLSPLAYGTGIKTKILEAMAMGMPVVTNSIGAEGIAAQNQEHWLVSDDAQQLGKYIDFILENRKLGSKMGKNACEFIEKYYQWEYVFSQFSRLNL